MQIQSTLESANQIALFGHTNIDGDALGSILGLGKLLKQQQKKVSYFTPITPDQVFNFLPDLPFINTQFDYGDYDILVFLDFHGYNRIPQFTKDHETYFDQKTIIIIDHHENSLSPNNPLHYIKPRALSTCELVFKLTYSRRPALFTHNISTYLLLGIITDTANFQYWNNNQNIDTFQIANQLLTLWANKYDIIDHLFNRESIEQIKFIGVLANRIKIQNNILSTYFTQDELPAHGIRIEQAKLIFDAVIKKIYGPHLYILLREQDWQIRWSIRTTTNTAQKADCAAIAKLFDGGGHKEAAGFSYNITKDFDTDKETILNTITDQYQTISTKP